MLDCVGRNVLILMDRYPLGCCGLGTKLDIHEALYFIPGRLIWAGDRVLWL